MYQLVASMSVGETVAGAVSVVLGTGQALAVPLSAWFCASAVHLRSAVAASTAVCFLCLSLERYITVVHGLRYYDILTEGRQRALLAASWLFAAVYLAFGLAMRWVHGLGPAREMCMYWTAVTLEFRFYGAIFCLLAYIVNLAINVVVGVIGIEQGKRIHRQQTGVNGKFRHSLLQHKGYMAIAILSLMCCIFVFPNILMNLLQSLEIIDRTFVHKVTAALRLLSMVTDGWCLALLCPKLRKEYIAIFGCWKRRSRGRSSRQASINVISTPKSRLETVAGRRLGVPSETPETQLDSLQLRSCHRNALQYGSI
ncbi:uncharacterized protein LOC122363976 [Amphibalanus amphitrite]|uniref:uncharacterized protein LOC122363976 n=1 Tax=Amphibalanus amphitrite TaxID=1232801 RepID=UPI001C90354D|nr:uncharacterized protein LOC122363976 [Amphibalanus amphitrite]